MADKDTNVPNKNDFISREAVIERFCNVYCGCSPEECGFKIQQDGAEECAAVRALKETPAADVVPVEWVPVKERLPEPCFPVWAACKAADGRENWVIETSYIPNPQSKSQWGPVPILETGRATVYAWAERHPPEAPKEG